MVKYTCEDCKYCGVIFADPYDEYKPLQKACPSEYLFNHPNPEECPNFKKSGPHECWLCKKRFETVAEFRRHKCPTRRRLRGSG